MTGKGDIFLYLHVFNRRLVKCKLGFSVFKTDSTLMKPCNDLAISFLNEPSLNLKVPRNSSF